MKKGFIRKFGNKGFKNFSKFDNFIQKCLDCYTIVDPLQEYYNITGKYSKYLISNKSNIPDLVIYNNTFNKNDCFYDYYGRNYNTFPRVKFNINMKSKNKIKVVKEENNFENNEKKLNNNNEEKNEKEKYNEDKKEKSKDEKNEIRNENINEIKKKENGLINNEIINNDKNEKEDINEDKKDSNDKKEYKEISDDKKENEIFDDEKDDYNDDDDDDDDLTNPTQFFAQIQSNKEKFNKEITNNILNKNDEKNKEILNSNIEKDKNEEEEIKNENEEIKNKKEEIKNEEIIEKEKNIQKKEELKEEKNQISNKNILINPKTKSNIIEAETESLTFIETKKSNNENINKNNSNNNNNINYNNNNSNQNEKNIPMMPQINFPFMHPFIYMQNPLINPNFSIPYNYSMMNQINYMNFQNDDDDEDDDPMLSNFNDDYSKYNPSVFLEKPELIVKKNLFNKNWILIKNNKVFSNFNSEELLYYLGNQIRLGNKFENISICDYQTDSFFMPSNLFDILRNTVPKLKKKFFQQKMMELNLNKNQFNMMNNNNIMINNYNSKFNSGK